MPHQNIMIWRHDGSWKPDIERFANYPVDQIDLGASKEDVGDWPDSKVLLCSLLASCQNFKLTSENRVFGGQGSRYTASHLRMYSIESSRSTGTNAVLNPFFNIEEMKESIHDEMATLTEGLDIRVILDDQIMENPKSTEFHQFKFKPFLHGQYAQYSEDNRDGAAKTELFLDGLPIQKQALRDNTLPSGFIVHLDEECFRPVHMGSGQLANVSTVVAFIEHDLRAVIRDRLKREKKEMSKKEFAQKHSLSCVREGVTSLLNDCPLHPNLWGYYPQLPHPYLPVVSRSSINREDFLEKTDFIVSQFHWLEGGVLALGSTYANAVQWPVLKTTLDPNHWASKAAVDVALMTIRMVPNEIYETVELTSSRLKHLYVTVCDNYRLSPTDDRFPSVKVEDLPTFCADTNRIVLTPASLDQVAALLLQIRDYATLKERQIDLRSLQADTLIVLRTAQRILADRKNAEHKAYLSAKMKQIGASFLGKKGDGND
jgi:hypothetical protein